MYFTFVLKNCFRGTCGFLALKKAKLESRSGRRSASTKIEFRIESKGISAIGFLSDFTGPNEFFDDDR